MTRQSVAFGAEAASAAALAASIVRRPLRQPNAPVDDIANALCGALMRKSAKALRPLADSPAGGGMAGGTGGRQRARTQDEILSFEKTVDQRGPLRDAGGGEQVMAIAPERWRGHEIHFSSRRGERCAQFLRQRRSEEMIVLRIDPQHRQS
jgi:hypothetical protein